MGQTTGGPALSHQRKLLKRTAKAIKETAFVLTQVQEQLDSLEDIVLQNQRALDLTAGHGEIYTYLQ